MSSKAMTIPAPPTPNPFAIASASPKFPTLPTSSPARLPKNSTIPTLGFPPTAASRSPTPSHRCRECRIVKNQILKIRYQISEIRFRKSDIKLEKSHIENSSFCNTPSPWSLLHMSYHKLIQVINKSNNFYHNDNDNFIEKNDTSS